jgi:hypothetical protein
VSVRDDDRGLQDQEEQTASTAHGRNSEEHLLAPNIPLLTFYRFGETQRWETIAP